MKELQTLLILSAVGIGGYYLYKNMEEKKQLKTPTQIEIQHPPSHPTHLQPHLSRPPLFRPPMVFKHLPSSHHFIR